MIRKRNTNKTILFLSVMLFILLLSLGYAVFSDTLTISGTATARGTFDLVFQNAKVVEGTAEGIDIEKTTAKISDDGNTLTINIADISHPGAGAEFSVDIVNIGTIPARIKSVIQTNIRGIGLAKITGLDEIGKERPTLQGQERYNICFRVEWDSEITDETEIENILDTIGDTVNFKLQLDYEQKTEDIFDGKPSHDGTEGETRPPMVIGKDNPTYDVPTNLFAKVGQTLADVKLPEGFTWNDPLSTSVGPAGINTFKVTFTPEDLDKYNILDDIDCLIMVNDPRLVAQIKGDDYGKSINYSVTVNGKEYSDWKVLYNDGKNVQIIMSDYLLQEEIPQSAILSGLEKVEIDEYQTYNVYSTQSRDKLINGLTNGWDEFALGIDGAKAAGAATKETMESSFREKYGKEWSQDAKKDTLYIPHPSQYKGCSGYWLTVPYSGNVESQYYVFYGGVIIYNYYNNTYLGVRPVVTLPTETLGRVGKIVTIQN